MSHIFPSDSQDTKLGKFRHMILHLSMDVFYGMDAQARLEIAKDAKRQFDKLSDSKYAFSTAEILAFPLLRLEEVDLPLDELILHMRMQLREMRDVVESIASSIGDA